MHVVSADHLAPDDPATVVDPTSLGEVAIVHDYLNQRGGAEAVVLELSDMWPDAPIYTSLYRPDSTFEGYQGRDIRTTFLDRLPVDRGFRTLFPLYPRAFRSFGPIDADVVISSSSGWAHMVRTTERALRVVYCYTPARWLYRHDYLMADAAWAWRETLASPLTGTMRRLDRRAAHSADLYIAISREVQTRIAATYGIDAQIIYPPADIERLRPLPRGERLLTIARLLPYKRVDLAIRAAQRLGFGLDVVGAGPELDALRAIAGPDVAFHNALPQARLNELLEGCRALCVAGEEDFGLAAVEAQAAGKPVVAYARGGALETVEDGVTGILFDEQTEDCVVRAIVASENLTTSPERIAQNAQRFSRDAFRTGLLTAIAAELSRRS